jgi:hypothetical protein
MRYFTLDQRAVIGYNAHAMTTPPLGGAEDVEGVKGGLADEGEQSSILVREGVFAKTGSGGRYF